MKYIIGIDEVGRGCLAGPVVVTALAIPRNFKVKSINFKTELRDSKQLSEQQREQWFEYIKAQRGIFYCVVRVSPKIIDKINISAAANRAAHRAISRLHKLSSDKCCYRNTCQMQRIYLDGGLYLRNKKYQTANYPQARTVVKGDEKFDAVKLASVVAKVMRDRYMKRLHKKYPQYSFGIHKGYGTKRHYAAIRKHGVSDTHRLTFLKKYHSI